jgi:hypothetical protein
MPINDGGPAFPQPAASDNAGGIWMSCEKGPEYAGMTLRDYFAAKAMQAELINNNGTEYEKIAEWAYQMADFMISERDKK